MKVVLIGLVIFLCSCSNEQNVKKIESTSASQNAKSVALEKDTAKLVKIEKEKEEKKLDLPFTGRKYFNFGGGFPRFEQFISIDLNGFTEIGTAIPEFAMFDEKQEIEYKGPYKNIIKTKYGIYKIEKTNISKVDINGKIENCSDGNGKSFPCSVKYH